MLIDKGFEVRIEYIEIILLITKIIWKGVLIMAQELKNIITNENVITKTSVEVAEMVGKAHNKLMRDIRGYIEDLKDSPKVDSHNLFVESTYINKQNKKQPCYLVTEKGCEFIANKLTGKKGSEFTAKYVEAFHDMQDALLEVVVKENEMFGRVRFAIINNKEYAVAKDVASTLGYKNTNDAIRTKCKGVVKHDGLKVNGICLSLIPEADIYRLIFGSKLPQAEQFQDWVFEEVLPTLRKHGAYIGDNSDAVNTDYIKFARGTVKQTFMDCPVEKLLDEYKACMEFYNNKNNRLNYYTNLDVNRNRKYRKDKKMSCNESKLEISNTIKDVLIERDNNLLINGSIGCSADIRNVINNISETIDEINKLTKSAKIGAKTREINKLKSELESLKPTPLEDMVCINYHAFSYDNSAIDKDGHWKPAYRTWIQNFPMEEIPSINYWLDRGVDFNKPVKIIIKCINKKEFDTTNLVKAIQDVLFNKERGKYRADDNFIRAGEIETIDFCDDYSDGKMYIDLENIDNCNIIDTNMDANMNEQLHNQEFAEFVSNLFGDF